MKRVYFYDCPRTGGTTFKQWSRRTRGFKRVFYGDGATGWHHVPFKPKEVVKQLAPNSEFYTFTILRNPIEHTASLYAKIRRHNHSYKSKLKNLSFKEWIYDHFPEDRKTSPSPWGFSMVRFFSENGDLAQAIKNLETVDFIAFTDNLSDDLNFFAKKIGVKDRFNNLKANQASRNFKMTEEDFKHLRKVRSEDFELVNYFRKLRGFEPY